MTRKLTTPKRLAACRPCTKRRCSHPRCMGTITVRSVFEAACGARLTYSYITTCGVTHDLPAGWVSAGLHSVKLRRRSP